ncbi:MAG: DUF433 domain-containing protein [Candidatus Loosdrechtia sp.]|uniref:DUF433 domain-containing protein n=1 Tax=Candidatus Loosdrechtia sp. TaxID=3101272 RepID=UPI003A6813A5|nr:MAG: DUF433 domain-containing protein [Candidatus Jettenia sp. AMX2]
MELAIKTNPLPLKKDPSGVIRIGETRVTLESIIFAFNSGATCEEIVYQYPVLDLADVYEVIGYYLRNKTDVDAYLEDQKRKASTIRQKVEAQFNPRGIRERLLKRRKSTG